MSHANAALTPRARLKLARLVVEDGWPIARAAERFQVAWPTAKRWADRYRAEGPPGMADRSSRPLRSPRATPAPVVRRIVHLRWKHRLGPVAIAARVGRAPSTVHQVLVRCRINRLAHVDRATGEPVRRYEHPAPGDLLHVDVKKLGNIPDGGGWRFVGRAQGKRHRAATPDKPRSRHGDPKLGTAFVHTVLDDHSRIAYAEIHDDETAATAAAVLRRAVAWFAVRGVVVRRVLSDNGSAYRSHLWRGTCAELAITPKRTRPYRPQTNGKIERFHRTMSAGWAFRRLYTGESQRRKALPGWIHEYNHHRPHTAIGGRPPISRLTNLSGQYSSPWPGTLIAAGAIISIFSVTLVVLYGQTRILFAIGRDGMLPRRFGEVHPRTQTPVYNTVVVAVAVSLLAGLLPINFLAEMTSIGTLVAFLVVSVGVIVLRRTQPDLPRGFRVPLYPVIPILSVAGCLWIIASLDVITMVAFVGWIVLAMAWYLGYGRRHSRLNADPGQVRR